MTETPRKPKPRPAPESLPYWQAAKEHRLALPKCEDCSQFWFPPSRTCPHCLSTNFSFQNVSGRGKVFSFVTFHRVYRPAFAEDVPYVVALVARCLPCQFLSTFLISRQFTQPLLPYWLCSLPQHLA
jgi:uncharacterized OB-fold protein